MSVTVRPLGTPGTRASDKALVPFAEEPATALYFPSEVHEEALARLMYVVEEQDRCGVLTGPTGVGKSTVMRRLHQLLRRTGWKSCRIDLAGLDHVALLRRLATELGANPATDADPHELWDQVELMIASAARVQQPWVLLFDHADRLRPGALSLLEQLLHSPHSRGLVMLFAARHEGRTPLLKTLSEQSGLRIELPALSIEETQRYVEHAFDRSQTPTPFWSRDAVQLLARITAGVPRSINRVCRAVILAMSVDYRNEVDSELILSVAEELLDL